MNNPSASLPRPTFSASFRHDLGSEVLSGADKALPVEAPAYAAAPEPSKVEDLVARGTAFVKAHWKQIGLAAVGLLGWRSARLRPLLRKAAMMYAVPALTKAFAARR